MNKVYRNKVVIASLIFPGLFLFCAVVLAPIVLSIYYSLTDFTGMATPQFIGLKNYAMMLKDEVFWRALRNSLFLGLGFILIQHPIAMLVAITLDRLPARFENLLRCIFFIPNVICVAIIAALWKFIYNPNFGLLTKVLTFLGYTERFNALGIKTALIAVLVVCIWHGFGWGMLIYYTGIKNVDPQLYEASALDGAYGLKEFFYITLPQLRPIVLYNFVSAIVSALKMMETVYLLTDGGPLDQTQFLAVYLYKCGFTKAQYGYGSAISVVFVLVCILATVVIKGAFKEKEV